MENKEFNIKDKLGYMFGDLGNDFTFILSTMILMKFYSDVIGVSVGLIGIMMMLARFFDAFTDIAMGQIVDRSRSKKSGKFKPWILRMCIPVALSSLLMYSPGISTWSYGLKLVWMFSTYLLWGSIFYTSINIPYGSMASAISPNPTDRAQLSNWRTIGASLAGTVIGILLPLIVYIEDNNGNKLLSGQRVYYTAVICSVLAIVSYILCYKLVTERVHIERKSDRLNIKSFISDVFRNKALIGIIAASICMLIVQLSGQQMANYVYPNYFRNTAAQSIAGLVGVVITLIMAAFTVKLSEKFGRKELAIAASVFGAIVYFGIYFIQTKNVWIYLSLYTVSYIGLAVFGLISWAMITDVVDDSEVKIGERSDGTIYAVYSFSRKLGQALSSGIAGAMLTFIGYSSTTQFEPVVTKGIYDLSCLIPAIGYVLLAGILFFFYPLNRKLVNKNAQILADKRKQSHP